MTLRRIYAPVSSGTRVEPILPRRTLIRFRPGRLSPCTRALHMMLVLCGLLLSGCADGPGQITGQRLGLVASEARVTQAQACAIGYDLARQIHDRVSLRHTVLLAPRRATPCERHALTYLARSGFRIDTTGQGGTPLNVTLTRLDRGDGEDGETVSAVARIGADLRIARSYRPVATGVLAAGPPSIQHMNPDTYTQRRSGP